MRSRVLLVCYFLHKYLSVFYAVSSVHDENYAWFVIVHQLDVCMFSLCSDHQISEAEESTISCEKNSYVL